MMRILKISIVAFEELQIIELCSHFESYLTACHLGNQESGSLKKLLIYVSEKKMLTEMHSLSVPYSTKTYCIQKFSNQNRTKEFFSRCGIEVHSLLRLENVLQKKKIVENAASLITFQLLVVDELFQSDG